MARYDGILLGVGEGESGPVLFVGMEDANSNRFFVPVQFGSFERPSFAVLETEAPASTASVRDAGAQRRGLIYLLAESTASRYFMRPVIVATLMSTDFKPGYGSLHEDLVHERQHEQESLLRFAHSVQVGPFEESNPPPYVNDPTGGGAIPVTTSLVVQLATGAFAPRDPVQDASFAALMEDRAEAWNTGALPLSDRERWSSRLGFMNFGLEASDVVNKGQGGRWLVVGYLLGAIRVGQNQVILLVGMEDADGHRFFVPFRAGPASRPNISVDHANSANPSDPERLPDSCVGYYCFGATYWPDELYEELASDEFIPVAVRFDLMTRGCSREDRRYLDAAVCKERASYASTAADLVALMRIARKRSISGSSKPWFVDAVPTSLDRLPEIGDLTTRFCAPSTPFCSE